MADTKHATDSVEMDQLAALRAAVQMGVDDVAAGRFEDLDDVHTWTQGIVDGITTKSVA